MKKILTLIVMACVTMGAWADDTWTVAGSCNLFNSEWDISDDDNDMVYQGENSHTWRWQKTNVVLCSGQSYKFKVVKNHSYGVESYPSDDYWLNGTHFPATGLYTVTIDFYDDSHNFSVICTQTGDVDGVYNVAGASAMLGSDWKPWDTKNQMTLQSDGTYKLVKEQVTLSNGSYDYKVCKDHNWYDAGGGTGTKDNASLLVSYSGTLDVKYDITFTIDLSQNPNTVTASAVKKAYNITLNENEDVAAKIGETCQVGDNSITVNRTLHAGHWNTICLPFSMSSENLEATFGSGWKLAKFTGCTDNTMTFVQVYEADHNTPYLLWVPEAENNMSTFTVTYDYINHDNERLTVNPNNAGYKMIGTLAPATLAEGALFINSDKVYRSIGSSTIKAMSAYFEVPSAGARSFTFSVDGEATGIISIEKDGSINVEETVYDLQGRKVTNPKHGLYIINGKKVMK